MKPVGTKPIRTARLLLRAPEMADAAPLVQARSLTMPLPEARKTIAAMMDECAHPFAFHWVITLEHLAIGRIKGWDINPYNGYLQLGYDLSPVYREQGYMTEAVRAVLDYLFSQAQVNRVFCSIREGNLTSRRVCEKCGMQHEGTLRRHYARQDGGYDDVMIYGILQSEWHAGEA